MQKLSVITINFNNSAGLQKTLQSVVKQTYTNLEYILIDGGSSDSSVDIIKQHESSIHYWVSEPDKGIYNAMNKGIAQATGEYCLFLNSGDVLVANDVLTKVFSNQIDDEIIYGDIYFGKRKVSFPENLDLEYFVKSSLGHPSTFIKRELFSKIGYYNESLKIISDWEFFVKAIVIEKCTYHYLIGQPISIFNVGGASMDAINEKKHHLEKVMVLNNLVPQLCTNHSSEIAEMLIKSGESSRSKIVQIALRFENSFLIRILKNLYHLI